MRFLLAIFSLFVLLVVMLTSISYAHEWYDLECCSDKDCAPVLKTKNGPVPGSLYITSKHGTVLINKNFPKRQSRDNQEHICMANVAEDGGPVAICYYVPFGS